MALYLNGKRVVSSGYEEVVLYSGTNPNLYSYPLSDSISNYDLIWVMANRQGQSAKYGGSTMVPSSYLISIMPNVSYIGICTDDKFLFFSASNETTMNKMDASDLYITKIIGIRWGIKTA